MPIYPSLALSFGGRAGILASELTTDTSNSHLNRALASNLSVTYHPASSMNFYLRRAQSFRFPKADENAFAADNENGLRTERGLSYETGVEINQTHCYLKLNIYQLTLHDEIAFDPTQTASLPFGTNRNLAETVRRGFNLSARYQVLSNIHLSGQYDFVDARFQSGPQANNRIPLVPEHILHANILYQLTPRLNIFTGVTYTGNEYTANDDQNIAGKIGGYVLYHLNIRYQHKPFSLAFRINNIFNKHYYFYTVLQQSTKFFYPAPERNFTLTINFELC